jgi:hypothetical protein
MIASTKPNLVYLKNERLPFSQGTLPSSAFINLIIFNKHLKEIIFITRPGHAPALDNSIFSLEIFYT